MDDCLACELLDGCRPCPGGSIDETDCWAVQHCVGPLGVGTAGDRLRAVLSGARG